jgi:hypothetical protein
MHISLDQAIGRQPRLNRVGQSLLNIASGASAAYSLRSLTGDEPRAVRIRRDGDNEERDFTTTEIATEAAAWTNGLQETTLPADHGTCAAAYSLRKVKSDYTGHAVRIRRESDDVEVNVSFDTNDEVSTSSPIENTTEQGGESGSTTATTLGEFISGTNAAVHTWYDQSGNSNNATQEEDASQPLLAEGGNLNLDDALKPQIDFTSDPTFLAFTPVSFTNETIFVKSSSVLINAFSTVISNADNRAVIDQSTNDVQYNVTAGGFATISASHANDDQVFTFMRDSTNVSVFQNGVAKGTSTTYANDSIQRSVIGRRGDTEGEYSGAMSEYILYGVAQIDNRFKVESNINNHYGLYTAAQNGLVNTWYDQSGNSKNATAEADADEPEIVKDGNLLTDSGGRPEIQFDGTSHHFNINFGSDLNQPNTIVMVHQSDTTTATKNEFFDREGTSVNPRTLLDQVTSNNYRMLAQATGDTGVAVDTNKNLVVALYNGSSSVLTKNGTAGSAFNSGTQGINQNSEIGRSDASSGNYDGTMQEFIIYNANQSSVQTALETNIANHYGITLS